VHPTLHFLYISLLCCLTSTAIGGKTYNAENTPEIHYCTEVGIKWVQSGCQYFQGHTPLARHCMCIYSSGVSIHQNVMNVADVWRDSSFNRQFLFSDAFSERKSKSNGITLPGFVLRGLMFHRRLSLWIVLAGCFIAHLMHVNKYSTRTNQGLNQGPLGWEYNVWPPELCSIYPFRTKFIFHIK
jgi:hypothetical protein